MAISYPIDATAILPNPVSIELTLRRVTGMSESPFTFQQQVYEHQGARWEMNMTFAPQTRADAAAIHGFLAALRGRRGTFLYTPDPLATAPISGGSDGNLSGNHAARATTITTSANETWSVGDLISISNHVYRIAQKNCGTSLCNSYDIEPGLRAAATSGTAIDATSPKGIWRLASDEFTYSIDVGQFYRTTIACVEAL